MEYLDSLFESLKSSMPSDIEETDVGIEFNSPRIFDEEELECSKSHPFEETFKRLNNSILKLNEISYKDFKTDDTQTVKQKLNNSILEINKGLNHAEKLIGHALKLKSEVGANQSIFFKDTFRKFSIIGERMNRLQSKIREFSK